MHLHKQVTAMQLIAMTSSTALSKPVHVQGVYVYKKQLHDHSLFESEYGKEKDRQVQED